MSTPHLANSNTLVASPLARLLRLTSNWKLAWDKEIKLLVDGKEHLAFQLDSIAELSGKRGLLRGQVEFRFTDGRSLTLNWVSNESFKSNLNCLVYLVNESLDRRARQRLLEIVRVLDDWRGWAETRFQETLTKRGWIAKSDLVRLKARKLGLLKQFPELNLESFEQDKKSSLVEKLDLFVPGKGKDLLAAWAEPLESAARQRNYVFFNETQTALKTFFNTFESHPLTQEQVDAVIQLEDRMLLVASAGSGKTSTLTAKIAYLVKQGYCEPQEILALSFNKAASVEMGNRLKEKAEKLGISCDGVHTRTFHGFGLGLIGEITGKKPRAAPWMVDGQDIAKVSEIANTFKTKSSSFRYNWDLFKAVFLKEIPSPDDDFANAESYNRETRSRGFRTNRGEIVKSHSERVLCNWLYFNDIDYRYEQKYEIPTATSTHGQYHPDFFLPDFGVYLELWALNANGLPPPDFYGYASSMEWKKKLHKEHNTILLEVTSHEIRTGDAFKKLSEYFLPEGTTHENTLLPEDQIFKNEVNCQLAKLCRQLISLLKTNEISISDFKSHLSDIDEGFDYRYALFIQLFEPIFEQWQKQLTENNWVDFDDMLLLSNQLLDRPGYVSSYKYILVDEFQDSSQLRLKILEKVAKSSGAKTFVVGDDWQSINRFAGADSHALKNLSERSGEASTLFLQKTFRCNQAICDVAGNFVKVDKDLIPKKVTSHEKTTLVSQAVRLIKVKASDQIRDAVLSSLRQLEQQARRLGEKQTVFILGRYNQDKYRYYEEIKFDSISVEFSTMHSSKGRECDHVIIPAMLGGASGFPSLVENDPLLTACLPNQDGIKNAEERRLFYVAMTRAKKSITLITVSGMESDFVKELIAENRTITVEINGKNRDELQPCPECKLGELEIKPGVNRDFWGCNRFPSCTYIQRNRNLDKNSRATTINTKRN